MPFCRQVPRPNIDSTWCFRTPFSNDFDWGWWQEWYVVELCESVPDLIQLDSEFHKLQGRRNVITILTDGEKDPMVMGFKLMDDSPERFLFNLKVICPRTMMDRLWTSMWPRCKLRAKKFQWVRLLFVQVQMMKSLSMEPSSNLQVRWQLCVLDVLSTTCRVQVLRSSASSVLQSTRNVWSLRWSWQPPKTVRKNWKGNLVPLQLQNRLQNWNRRNIDSHIFLTQIGAPAVWCIVLGPIVMKELVNHTKEVSPPFPLISFTRRLMDRRSPQKKLLIRCWALSSFAVPLDLFHACLCNQ